MDARLVADNSNIRHYLDLDALWTRFAQQKPATEEGLYDWIGDFSPFGSFPSGPLVRRSSIGSPKRETVSAPVLSSGLPSHSPLN